MESFINVDNFWDLPQHPATFSSLPEDDFLALLQKQFPSSNNIFDISPPDGVDPLNINPLVIPNPTPPSTDSSPSPPSVAQEPATSRPQSGVFNAEGSGSPSTNDDPSLKRKASDESMEEHNGQPSNCEFPPRVCLHARTGAELRCYCHLLSFIIRPGQQKTRFWPASS